MEKTLAVSVVIGAVLGKKYVSTFDSAKTRAVKLGRAFKETDQKLAAANGVIHYRDLLKTLQAKQRAAGGGSQKLSEGIQAVEVRYQQAKRSAKAYGLSIGEITQAQKKLQRESTKLAHQLQRLEKTQGAKERLGALKTRALGAIGLAYGAGKIIGQSFELENKKHQLGDVITGERRDERLQASLQHAKAFARNSLASEAAILEIDYALRSSGLDDDAAQFGSEIVAKVATVTKGSASDVGFIIGDTFTNMGAQMEGTTEEKIKRIGDVLTKTKNLFSIKDFNQLGEGLKEGLSAAIANRLSLEQTVALIGQINNGMLKGSQAGTGLNALLRQLPKAAAGLDFEMIRNDEGTLDTIATLESLKAALAFIDDPDEKAMLLQKYFGDEGKKALLPLLENLAQLKENFKEVQEKAQGTLDEGYQRRMQSASGQWTLLRQNLSSVGTTFANTLLPALNLTLAPLARLMGWVGKMIEEFPVIGWALGGIASGFIVTAGVLGALTAAQWLWNAALLANPIGLVIAGIALLIGGAYALYQNWSTVTAWFNEQLEAIGEKFSWIGDLYSRLFGENKEATVTLSQKEDVSYHEKRYGRYASLKNPETPRSNRAATPGITPATIPLETLPPFDKLKATPFFNAPQNEERPIKAPMGDAIPMPFSTPPALALEKQPVFLDENQNKERSHEIQIGAAVSQATVPLETLSPFDKLKATPFFNAPQNERPEGMAQARVELETLAPFDRLKATPFSRANLAESPAKGAVTHHHTVNAPITINVPKGMDPIEVGRAVEQQLKEREHALVAEQRGALFDYEGEAP